MYNSVVMKLYFFCSAACHFAVSCSAVCFNLMVVYQSGKYETPGWLSRGSVQILDDLLQVDPRRRIPIRQLMRHPWLKMGGEHNVTSKSKFSVGVVTSLTSA